MDNKTIKILETIDLNPEPLLDKQKLLNLIKLSKQNNIQLFDENRGKIKSKRKILEDCTACRNNKIDSYVKDLDEKKNKTKSTNKIKILNDNFTKELESLENIVKYVNDTDFKILKNISETNKTNNLDSDNEIKDLQSKLSKNNQPKNDYIEIFSNDPSN